jgi:hypothetical protein
MGVAEKSWLMFGCLNSVNFTIWQCGVAKQVKSTWQNSQITMWT